ncbi:Splicing factor 3A subunit 3 [Borealophlyctis nickersoniae]|nr:Splicing factor 3A subunit 3 [Borealophlyctis nickersoniae]
MDSILEQQRRAHEEIERIELVTVEELLQKPKTHKEKLIQDHRVDQYLERIQSRSQYLLDLYEDEDGSRRSEVMAISGATEFSEFYERLKKIKDYHRRYPNEVIEPMELEFAVRDTAREERDLENKFSGEEGLGKYLDLNAVFEQYVNLKDVKKINYVNFLGNFHKFGDIPKSTKKTPEYAKYINDSKVYLESFFARSQPLFNLREVRERLATEFEQQWEAGTLPGWEPEPQNGTEFYCIACEKQFAKQTVYDAHLNGKKHQKAAAGLLEKGITAITPEQRAEAQKVKERKARQRDKPIALAEALIKEYATLLEPQLEDTKANVERKQALTDEERRRLLESTEEIEIPEEEEEEEEKIYNPLKLPLGWDGKPIPYWLYKLHGLGVEYQCEICGNYVYMGRKAFDRHFQEWRHAHGMRCLGIPNTRHFHEITLIEDAYSLWEKLKGNSKLDSYNNDVTEEFEDADGNVFNKKTYEDLKRQGLL